MRAGLRAAEGTPASDAGAACDTLRRTRLALTFLDTGRRALAGKRHSAAIEAAESLLECCAAARDEFGVSLAVLAGRQLAGAWRQQGRIATNLPVLIARFIDLVHRGAIGHPNDLVDVAGFIAATGDLSAGAPLLARLEQSADAVARTVNTAQRLAAWLPASGRLPAAAPGFETAALTLHGRDVIAGRYTRPAGGTLVVLFDTAALASAIADSWQAPAFEAALVTGSAFPVTAPAARVPLIADMPGVQMPCTRGRATRPARGGARSCSRRRCSRRSP